MSIQGFCVDCDAECVAANLAEKDPDDLEQARSHARAWKALAKRNRTKHQNVLVAWTNSLAWIGRVLGIDSGNIDSICGEIRTMQDAAEVNTAEIIRLRAEVERLKALETLISVSAVTVHLEFGGGIHIKTSGDEWMVSDDRGRVPTTWCPSFERAIARAREIERGE